jgi:hypothetical protein
MDDAPSTLHVGDVALANCRQPGAYVAQLPFIKEKINEETLTSSRGCFEVTTPLCIYKKRYFFPYLGIY